MAKLLCDNPSMNGTMINGSFYATSRSTEVDLSVLASEDQILKLSHTSVASKKPLQIASEINRLRDQSPQAGGIGELILFLSLSLHRLVTLLLPEAQFSPPSASSPYGAALIFPIGEGGVTDHSLYLIEPTVTSSVSLFLPPMTLCFPRIALKRQNLTKTVAVSLVIERSVGTVHQGTHLFHELKRALSKSSSRREEKR
jgi:hypothetical protein